MNVDYPEINFSGNAKSDIIFLKNNSLWYFFSSKNSRYFGGYLFFKQNAWRFLDKISFTKQIKGYQILGNNKIILYFANNQALIELQPFSLEITLDDWDNIKVTFDIKKIFDNNPFLRQVNISPLTANIVFVKELFENFELILKIEADAPLKINNFWQEEEMDFDQKRNSPPFNWWIYNGLEGKVKQLKIIIDNPTLDNRNIKKIVCLNDNRLSNFILQRIDSLLLDSYLPAGFPWFFENWYRDELLTLYLIQKYLNNNFRQQRLINYLTNLEDIWNKNKFFQPNIASDTLLLLIANLNKELILSYGSIIEKFFNLWQKEFIKNEEINLPPYSTWMDTRERTQAIEISALYLKSLKQLSVFRKDYSLMANKFKDNFLKKIKNQIDINIVFVFFFLEDILPIDNWQKIFTKLIRENYLSWGGFSSISKNDHDFQFKDTGENSPAYHYGDSWYYINNLIAFALKKINHQKFKLFLNKIIISSLKDLLLDGALGFSSELSEAQNRTSHGALVQVWSLASLLRLFQDVDIFLESLSNSHNIISIKA